MRTIVYRTNIHGEESGLSSQPGGAPLSGSEISSSLSVRLVHLGLTSAAGTHQMNFPSSGGLNFLSALDTHSFVASLHPQPESA